MSFKTFTEAKRGRPSKTAPVEGSEDHGPEGMEAKLRKATDYITLGKEAEKAGEKNAHPKTVAIQFGNGKTHELPHDHIVHALKTIESWKGPGKNPDERMEKLRDMDKSHEHFLKHMGKMPELKKANEEVTTEARGVAPQAVDKHNCVTHVYHEQFGEGQTMYSEHAVPDAEGNIAWYDVMFEHGIEHQVAINEVKILNMESHGDHPKKKKMKEEVEQIDEGDTMHTHTAHLSDPVSNEWKGKMLIVADNDADAIKQAQSMAKAEGLKLMKVSKNVVVMSNKAIGEEVVAEKKMCKDHGKYDGKSCSKCMTEEKQLSPKQKNIAAIAGDPTKIDAEDFKKLRSIKKEKEPTNEKEKVMTKESKQTSHTAASRYHAVESAVRDIMSQNRDLRTEAKEAEWKKNNLNEVSEQFNEAKEYTPRAHRPMSLSNLLYNLDPQAGGSFSLHPSSHHIKDAKDIKPGDTVHVIDYRKHAGRPHPDWVPEHDHVAIHVKKDPPNSRLRPVDVPTSMDYEHTPLKRPAGL